MSNITREGESLENAKKVAIMIHGRGATGKSILSLKDHLNLDTFALLAPNAIDQTWYPYSFMAPDRQNEPAFSHAIQIIGDLVKECLEKGILPENLYFIGFSQGACLTLEYTTQNARKYGGVIAFTGGLIGEQINKEKYQGNFEDTPVFIGSGHIDMHVPLSRIEESEKVITALGAKVKTLIFKDPQHTIRQQEIDWVNENILS